MTFTLASPAETEVRDTTASPDESVTAVDEDKSPRVVVKVTLNGLCMGTPYWSKSTAVISAVSVPSASMTDGAGETSAELTSWATKCISAVLLEPSRDARTATAPTVPDFTCTDARPRPPVMGACLLTVPSLKVPVPVVISKVISVPSGRGMPPASFTSAVTMEVVVLLAGMLSGRTVIAMVCAGG